MKGIIANSFPKSGTHILTRILELLEYSPADTHLSRSLIMYGQRNLLRNISIYKRIEKRASYGLHIDLEVPNRKVKDNWFAQHLEKHLHNESYVQAHLPHSEKLEAFFKDKNFRMLYIHRDPRDALVSLKNYILNFKKHPNHKLLSKAGTDDDRFIMLLNGFDQGSNIDRMAPFLDKYRRSIRWKDSDTCCSLEYEKIIGLGGGGSKSEQKMELHKIFTYLGKDHEPIDKIQKNVFYTKSPTFHRGIIGQWQEEFSPRILEIFKKQLADSNTSPTQ